MIHLQAAQNAALRLATGSHQMSSVHHLYQEAKMLKVQEHQELLSAQYLVRCLEEHTCHDITEVDPPPTQIMDTFDQASPLYILEMQPAIRRRAPSTHNTVGERHQKPVQEHRAQSLPPPPPINDEETLVKRSQRTTLAELRSG